MDLNQPTHPLQILFIGLTVVVMSLADYWILIDHFLVYATHAGGFVLMVLGFLKWYRERKTKQHVKLDKK